MTIVFKISDNLKPSFIKYYQNQCLEKHPPYSVFQAKEADTTITLYESGKVMFQGISADIDANIWIDLEKKHNNRIIDIKTGKDKNNKKDKAPQNFDNYNTIGSDEVGTGDYFGPIVVTACYVNKKDSEFLHQLKVTDSKKLTDEKIIELVPKIIPKILYSTLILMPKEYNEKYNKDINMNKIKAIMHNKVLLNILHKNPNYEKIIVDQFVNPKKYYEYLNDSKEKVTNITFTPRAEDQALSVACASIISRYIFLNEMNKLSNIIGKSIPKGAGKEVDDFIKENLAIIQKKGISSFVKLNFKNTEKLNTNLQNN